jgi:hypothetical protein
MLIGWAIANTKSHTNKPNGFLERLGMPMIPEKVFTKSDDPRYDRGLYVQAIITAATQAGFFSIRDHEEGKKIMNDKSLYEITVELLTGAVTTKRRLGYKPSALVGRLVYKEEINRMNQLGVYAPFKA